MSSRNLVHLLRASNLDQNLEISPDRVILVVWEQDAKFLVLNLPVWLIRKYVRPFRGLRFMAYAVLGLTGSIYDENGTAADDEVTWDDRPTAIEGGGYFYFLADKPGPHRRAGGRLRPRPAGGASLG